MPRPPKVGGQGAERGEALRKVGSDSEPTQGFHPANPSRVPCTLSGGTERRADLTTDRPEFVVISTPAPHPLRLNPAKERFTAIHHQKWSFPCQDASVSTTWYPRSRVTIRQRPWSVKSSQCTQPCGEKATTPFPPLWSCVVRAVPSRCAFRWTPAPNRTPSTRCSHRPPKACGHFGSRRGAIPSPPGSTPWKQSSPSGRGRPSWPTTWKSVRACSNRPRTRYRGATGPGSRPSRRRCAAIRR